jgi:CBS domain-containing protein
MSNEEGFLGLTIGSLALAAPVFVDSETSVMEAARAMSAASASACLVGSSETVAGIVTERDIAQAVADGRDLTGPVRLVMTTDVVCVSGDELVSEAFLIMIRRRIRRLVLVEEQGGQNGQGRVTGLLDERDLLAARLESPVALATAISKARDAGDLAQAYAGLGVLIPRWLTQGADVFRAGALAAAVRDQLFARAAELAQSGGADPGPLALAALGSEGRREQFLATDQDNALVLGEEADPAAAEAFAVRLMAILDQVGLPPCPNGVTADRAAWRMTLAGWREHLARLGRDLGPEAVLALSLLADARHMFGDAELTDGLRLALVQAVRENPRSLRYMAREAARFEPPLSVFGKLLIGRGGGKGGPGAGWLDVKRGGIFPLTQGARVLALELGTERTDTASRLTEAALSGVLSGETASDLTQALAFLQELRLRFQAEALAAGREPDNMVYPERLSSLERARLKDCFRVVAAFQALLANRYALRMLT